MDRENFDIAVRHIPGHHGYLEDLKLRSRHHRSIDLASNPSAPAIKGDDDAGLPSGCASECDLGCTSQSPPRSCGHGPVVQASRPNQ
jgi:hypothetical protein